MSNSAVELRNSANQTSGYKLIVYQEILLRISNLDDELSQYADVQHLLDEFREFRGSVQVYRHTLVAHIKNLEEEDVAST